MIILHGACRGRVVGCAAVDVPKTFDGINESKVPVSLIDFFDSDFAAEQAEAKLSHDCFEND